MKSRLIVAASVVAASMVDIKIRPDEVQPLLEEEERISK